MLHVPNQHGCHEKGARMHLRSRYLINSMLEYKMRFKVEKIIKDSLDSIPSPSPSVKIQIMDGKVCLSCIGKTLIGIVNKLLKAERLLTSPSDVLPY